MEAAESGFYVIGEFAFAVNGVEEEEVFGGEAFECFCADVFQEAEELFVLDFAVECEVYLVIITFAVVGPRFAFLNAGFEERSFCRNSLRC